MNIKQTMGLSKIVNKMGIKITNAEASTEAVGADLLLQIASNLYKAETEIYTFVGDLKKITPEAAQEVDIMDMIEQLKEVKGLKRFFPLAATPDTQK